MGPTRRSEIVGTTMAAVAFALSVLTGVVTAFPGAALSPRAGVAWVVALTLAGIVGVWRLRGDRDGAGARWAGDVLRGAGAVLGFVVLALMARPVAFAPPLTPASLAEGLAPGFVAAVFVVGLSRLSGRHAPADGQFAAPLSLAVLLVALVGAVAFQRHATLPRHYLREMELIARLPAFRDVRSLRDVGPDTLRVVPLGRVFVCQRCGRSGRCEVWVTPRRGDATESPPTTAPERVPTGFADDRELNVRADATRDLLSLDDGVLQALFDRERGAPHATAWDQLRPAPAPPLRWTILGALAGVLGLAALRWSRQARAAPVEGMLRDDGTIVQEGRVVRAAAPPGVAPGPVLIWLEASATTAHYRDVGSTTAARVEAGTLADHRASSIARGVGRRALVTGLALLGAAPLLAWGFGALPPRVRPTAGATRTALAEGLVLEE
ncbi:MAG: hypothetical protein U0325_36800, partial [Polyangiales bacterium]